MCELCCIQQRQDNIRFEVIQMDSEAMWEGKGGDNKQSNVFYTFPY